MNFTALGKQSHYPRSYDKSLLQSIPRDYRHSFGEKKSLPRYGEDIWNLYEVSWLNQNGKPMIATVEMRIPADSPYFIESKSLKLYLNSLNQTNFTSQEDVYQTLKNDIQSMIKSDIHLVFNPKKNFCISELEGISIDNEDITVTSYTLSPEYLEKAIISNEKKVCEKLYSHLLKSNCAITQQPDWASVQIYYEGLQINRALLLKYLVSFRNICEFHEPCVERIFTDIMYYCCPDILVVQANYTRRGGIDINPWRSNKKMSIDHQRLVRQ